MNPDHSKNISASVRQRLLNRARSEGRPFQEILQYYAMERFLFRLSRSACAQDFILKGALMLRAWRSPEYRSTMDIDVLGKTSNEVARVIEHIQEIISVEVEVDGLTFDVTSIQAERITEGADYEGIRIRFHGGLGSAKIIMQLDVGFGDVIFPSPEELELPTVLDFPAPKLLCYSKESVIAEKFEAMLKLGELNSRMKDFYDIWLLARWFDFEGENFAEAIRRTLENRRAVLSSDIVAFSDDFVNAKQMQWSAFRTRLHGDEAPVDFVEVVSSIASFITPIISGLRSGESPPTKWIAPGPWTRD